ncbi:ankyrin repeat domain-containing protein 9 isoform X3 [Camelus ferus]|uniref:Ankyrin repeat domain-containing protein 9 isoform X3 n=1 Tax=Camelus ferus TaxID=419612 RepID=A0A8B8T8P0_CAMFR|nr:ankyrin repeat domain-containing protein 9 isoform X3 [Camelus ferus]
MEKQATVSETAPEDVFPKVTDGQCKGDLDYDSCGDEQIHAWRGPGVYSRAQTPTGRRHRRLGPGALPRAGRRLLGPGAFPGPQLGFPGAPPRWLQSRPHPLAPSSFSQLFRGSRRAPRPPAGDVTMVQSNGQWAAAGAGSAGQWWQRAAPRSCPAGAALRRPPPARPPARRRRRHRRAAIGPRRLRARLRRARAAAAPSLPSVLGSSPARLPARGQHALWPAAGAGTPGPRPRQPQDEEAEAQKRKVINYLHKTR